MRKSGVRIYLRYKDIYHLICFTYGLCTVFKFLAFVCRCGVRTRVQQYAGEILTGYSVAYKNDFSLRPSFNQFFFEC